jgi:ATP/maltotriose-dependent transcriptional regulator MalT
VGITRRVAATLRLIGDLARIEGHYEEAEDRYREALDIATEIGDRPQEASLLLSQARLMADQEETKREADFLSGALTIYEEIGDARGMTGACLLIAKFNLCRGHLQQALEMTKRAFKTARQTDLLHPRVLLGALRRYRI